MWRVVVAFVAACGFGPTTSSATGDDASSDGTSDGTAGLPVGRCSEPGAIRDNFNDGVIATQWASDTNGGTVVEQSGAVVVTPTTTPFTGLVSKHYVDLTGAAIQVEVPQMVDVGTSAVAELVGEADTSHYVAFIQRNGQLTADLDNGGVHTSLSVAYDPVGHRFWRISESAGMVHFATSPDGASWTELQSVATPPFATTLRIDLGATGTGVSAGAVAFDNLNTTMPLASWCKANTLHDTFARSTFGYGWNNRYSSGGGCNMYVSNGAHTDQNGAPATCFFGTAAAFDLTNSSVVVVITAITNWTNGWVTFLRALRDDGHQIALAFESDQMCVRIDQGAPTCRAYNTADSYWRIAEAAGTLTFDTSANQTTWTPVLSIADPFPLDAVELQFGTTSTVDLQSQPIGLDTSSYN
jgi:hypothetical protein